MLIMWMGLLLPCYLACGSIRTAVGAISPCSIRAFVLAYLATLNTARQIEQKRSEAFYNLICFFGFHIGVRKLFRYATAKMYIIWHHETV